MTERQVSEATEGLAATVLSDAEPAPVCCGDKSKVRDIEDILRPHVQWVCSFGGGSRGVAIVADKSMMQVWADQCPRSQGRPSQVILHMRPDSE